ncbi:hypothetical protein PT974_10869 [Cladobotryum mycophilum]|uniref:BTB domain-containing protein n=1 Tax=Cladobotryum mycophilum TaxID=491253 RepID=A0ABR0SB10_9HYPO
MSNISLAIIDPDGDTLVILPYVEESSPSSDKKIIASESGLQLATPGNEEPNGVNGPEAEHCESTLPPPLSEVHFRVSTKHLSLASRRAKIMFKGPYEESVPLPTDGLRRWIFEPIFNPTAFEIVMNIIHLQTHKIPDNLTLVMMANVAAIVDDLECHSAVDFFAKIWLHKLGTRIPDAAQPRELSQWVLISSVFNQSELFQTATHRAILHSKLPIPSFGLPIRPKIIEVMEGKRETGIRQVIEQLHKLMIKLSQDGQFCAVECQSMLLGALVQQMHTARLLSPIPPRPFNGISLWELLCTVRSFRSPKIYCPRGHAALGEEGNVWYLEQRNAGSAIKRQRKIMPPSSPTLPKSLVAHKCSLQAQIEPELKRLESQIKGLDSADFS